MFSALQNSILILERCLHFWFAIFVFVNFWNGDLSIAFLTQTQRKRTESSPGRQHLSPPVWLTALLFLQTHTRVLPSGRLHIAGCKSQAHKAPPLCSTRLHEAQYSPTTKVRPMSHLHSLTGSKPCVCQCKKDSITKHTFVFFCNVFILS